MKPIVFINYRRDDTGGDAARIRHEIESKLGDGAVYMDVKSVKPGTNWPVEIETALENATYVIAVIGNKWLSAKDEHERRRIDLQEDWVRKELEITLKSNKILIPVFVQGRTPIPKNVLPESIQSMADRQSISLRHEYWDHDIQVLLKELPSPISIPEAMGTTHVAISPPEEFKLRCQFLEQVAKDVTNRLASSVHAARFLELGIRHDPSAVGTMWGYKNPVSQKEYPDLATAFREANQRLLVLGQPGSGKTTALLHLAEILIADARTSLESPVPFFVNLSKFNRTLIKGRESSIDRDDQRFKDWLAEEIASVPGISRQLANHWIQTGKIAAFLDGLDEFNDDYRPELAHLINESFLKSNPNYVVVIASRTNDYSLLRGTNYRLRLEDAIELKPLTPEQIDQYLVNAEASGLVQAVRNDHSLQELAKIPLTLSMLTLAYSGLAPEEMPTALSLTESRERLFQEYVKRRLQREARRRQGRPMDDFRANDVAAKYFRYSEKQVHRWLGTLAICLSQRMTTVFSKDGIYSLMLPDDLNAKFQLLRHTSIVFANAMLLAASALAIAIPILPATLEGISWVVILFVTPVFIAAFTWVFVKDWLGTERNTHFVLGIPALCVGIWALAYAATAQWQSLSLVSVALVSANLTLLLHQLGCWVNNEKRDRDLMRSISSYSITLGLVVFTWSILRFLSIPNKSSDPAIVATFALVRTFTAKSNCRSMFTRLNDSITAFVLLFLGLNALRLLGPPGPGIVVLASVVLLFGLFSGWNASLLPLAISIPVVSLLGLGFGLPGTELGILLMLILWFIVYLVNGYFEPTQDRYLWLSNPKPESWLANRHVDIHDWLEARFLSPCVWFYWWILHRFPLRKQAFFSFCNQEYLLKSSAQGGMEFIHRLVRDYFALRQLMPNLRACSGSKKLEAIRLFGYQGESAIDPLMEIADGGDGEMCAAALEGLSHIASPAVTLCFERFLKDRRPVVRVALIESLFRLSSEDQNQLIQKISPLGDGCEAVPFVNRGNYMSTTAIDFIKRLGEPGIQCLLHEVSQPTFWRNITFRTDNYISCFVELKESRLFPILCEVAKNFELDKFQVKYLAYGLAKLGEEESLPALCSLLSKQKDESATRVLEEIERFPRIENAAAVFRWLSGQPFGSCIPLAARIILNLGDETYMQKLAAKWRKLRKRIPKQSLLKMKATDQWLKEFASIGIAPPSRPWESELASWVTEEAKAN